MPNKSPDLVESLDQFEDGGPDSGDMVPDSNGDANSDGKRPGEFAVIAFVFVFVAFIGYLAPHGAYESARANNPDVTFFSVHPFLLLLFVMESPMFVGLSFVQAFACEFSANNS
jgi:hypothetical protein